MRPGTGDKGRLQGAGVFSRAQISGPNLGLSTFDRRDRSTAPRTPQVAVSCCFDGRHCARANHVVVDLPRLDEVAYSPFRGENNGSSLGNGVGDELYRSSCALGSDTDVGQQGIEGE